LKENSTTKNLKDFERSFDGDFMSAKETWEFILKKFDEAISNSPTACCGPWKIPLKNEGDKESKEKNTEK